MKKYVNGIILTLITLPIALAIVYGVKDCVHKKCVEKALEMRLEKLPGHPKVVSAKVPRWHFLPPKYPCTAILQINDEQVQITFDAEGVSSLEGVKESITGDYNDDWDVNLGFWGWIGDDYHIKNIQVLESSK